MKDRNKMYQLCWKYHRMRKTPTKHKPYFDRIDAANSTANAIFEEINTFDKQKNNFLVSDIRSLFHNAPHLTNIYSHTNKSYSKITKQDMISFINDVIFTHPTDFDFYFKFGSRSDFKRNFRLGSGVFYSIHSIPEEIRRIILKHMPYEAGRRQYSGTEEDWIRTRKQDSYMKISVKSIGEDKAKQKAFAELQKNYNILKVVTGTSIQSQDRPETNFYYFMSGSNATSFIISDEYRFNYHITKPNVINKHIKKINKIFCKEKPTELEQRVMNAINMYGLIESTTPLPVRFSLCVIGLESLLLGKDDRDYLGSKVAEKIAFLLADEKLWLRELYNIPYSKFNKINNKFIQDHLFDSRQKLYNQIKNFYSKRSNFVHVGINSKSKLISEQDYKLGAEILRLSIAKIISLISKYDRIAKEHKTNKKYLDYYFEKLRYS